MARTVYDLKPGDRVTLTGTVNAIDLCAPGEDCMVDTISVSVEHARALHLVLAGEPRTIPFTVVLRPDSVTPAEATE